MLKLLQSARVADTAAFAETLTREIAALAPGSLPLVGEQGGRIDEADIGVTLLSQRADANRVDAVIGLFFTEVVGGCSCGDDPFVSQGYLELRLSIDRATGVAAFSRTDH
jgi:hypothetical protein